MLLIALPNAVYSIQGYGRGRGAPHAGAKRLRSLAQGRRLSLCSEYVRYLRSFCRVGEAIGMPPHDPSLPIDEVRFFWRCRGIDRHPQEQFIAVPNDDSPTESKDTQITHHQLELFSRTRRFRSRESRRSAGGLAAVSLPSRMWVRSSLPLNSIVRTRVPRRARSPYGT
jgi:hypothetical protein